MKDIADDLINDLEDLENATQELNDQVDQVVKNNTTLDKHTGETAMETAVLMLEASKMAQESSISSQEAASINLKLAGQQQQQIDSMHDAGISWRQTIRDANLEIKSSRSFFAGMLTSAIILTLIAIGLMSWLVLMSQNNQAESQSKLMDMIQTESSLNQRQINMKIDELASVVENALSYQRNGANNNNPSLSSRPADQELTEGSIDQSNQPKNTKTEVTQTTPESTSVKLDEVKQAISNSLNEYKDSLQQLAKINTPNANEQKVEFTALNNQVAKIENLLQAQSAQIASINKQLKNSMPQVTTPENPKPSDKNTSTSLNNQLTEMKNQLKLLESRQKEIQSSLNKLTNEFMKSKEEAKNEGPKPYSYRNPYEYKQ
ncbi:hypothetical protein [Thiomicrospira sp.]|uniref:hypothetical protein n=1 Tax=Thiomicrospira sp. TaxID=935 RepID=UPI002F935B33